MKVLREKKLFHLGKFPIKLLLYSGKFFVKDLQILVKTPMKNTPGISILSLTTLTHFLASTNIIKKQCVISHLSQCCSDWMKTHWLISGRDHDPHLDQNFIFMHFLKNKLAK